MRVGPAIEAKPAVLGAALAAAATVAQLVCAKAVRDALFLSSFDVRYLPRMMAAAAAASLVAALASSRAMSIWSPRRVLRVGLAVNALLYGLEWSLLVRAPEMAAIALYLQVAVFGSTLLATLWSVFNESFDPHTAKRYVGRITMGGTLGGVVGGLAAFALGRSGGMTALLGVLMFLNVAAIPAATKVRARPRRHAAERKAVAVRSGFAALRDIPYLRQLALMVSLVAIASALLDYVMSARVVAVITERGHLMTFFALFHTGVGLVSFVIQAVLTRPALERLGLAGTVAVLPIAVLATGAVALVAPSLWSALAARGADALMSSSLYRAGYELLYTPVPHAHKRPAKVLIDVGLDRVGTGIGTGIVMLALARVQSAVPLLLALAIGVSVVAVWTAVRLHRGYVSALADSLQRGSVNLSSADVFDATTRRTLAETRGLDRKRLLESIERRQRGDGDADSLFPPESDGGDVADTLDPVLPGERGAEFHAAPLSLRFAAMGAPDPAEDGLGAILDDLVGGSVASVRQRLNEREPLPPELVPAVVALLGRDELSRDALRTLRAVGPSITGQLVDALLDPSRDIVVRRRVPRVLEALPNERAVRGLVDGLFEAERDVRHQCAWALQRLTESAPRLSLPRDRILSAVRSELESVSVATAIEAEPGAQRAIEHAVVVLSLVLEREPLGLAYRALLSGDETLRGTALEYFENVLPEEVRAAGLPLFDHLRPSDRPKRDARELRDELLRTRSG